MQNLDDYILSLIAKGYHCSQVMMQLALDLRGEDNPILVRSLGGLGGGMFLHHNCGTLTGGACVLASYVPRTDDQEPGIYQEMVKELVQWFETENGSIQCRDLVQPDRQSILAFCPNLIAKTFAKVLEILADYGIDPQQSVE